MRQIKFIFPFFSPPSFLKRSFFAVWAAAAGEGEGASPALCVKEGVAKAALTGGWRGRDLVVCEVERAQLDSHTPA